MKNSTYGAGYRAGMAAKPLIIQPDGTKVIAHPECPFKLRRQFISRFMWEQGYHEGWRQSIIRSSKRWRAA